MLAEIDLVLHDHDTTAAQIAAAYFEDAMASVRDLIDHGCVLGSSAVYSPTDQVERPDLVRVLGLVNVHEPRLCTGRACTIHNPSGHHMDAWPMMWHQEARSFERLCPHGLSHPDPDQFAYWSAAGLMFRACHPCDQCCDPQSGLGASVIRTTLC